MRNNKMGANTVRNPDEAPWYARPSTAGDAAGEASAEDGVIHYGKMRAADRVELPEGDGCYPCKPTHSQDH